MKYSEGRSKTAEIQRLLSWKDTVKRKTSASFFQVRGGLDLRHDLSGHRRFLILYEDLLA